MKLHGMYRKLYSTVKEARSVCETQLMPPITANSYDGQDHKDRF